MHHHRWTFAFPYLLSLCGLMTPAKSQIAPHLVISEVYGGGGNSGSFYKNDFVELYNPTSFAVTMSGWSIQYQSATNTGATWQRTIISGTVLPHHYYLVQESQGSGGIAPLPAPDGAGSIPLGSTGGKVALADDTLAITGPASPTVVDFLGYGTANQFEGNAAAAGLSNTTSAVRKAQGVSTAASMSDGGVDSLAGNGWDSGDNHSDFVAGQTQGPQNSASPGELPPATGNLPPVISNVVRALLVADPGGTDTIFADIADPDGAVTSAGVSVRVDGGAFDSSITMRQVSGTRFLGVIPPSKHLVGGSLVEYFVSARDDSSGYASTRATMGGYFVGDATAAAVKSHPLSDVIRYGARVKGVLSAATNTFADGEGFMQDSTGGLSISTSGGLPALAAGRRVTAGGTITASNGAYQIGDPGFTLSDTTEGISPPAPVSVTLPVAENAGNPNEGMLVTIHGISTASTGTFLSGKSYLFRTVTSDTITVRVESYAGLNTLPGTAIPSSAVDGVGILSFSGGFCRLLPRSAYDMGNSPVRTYEAVASGNWSDTNTWSGKSVPGDTSDVTFSTPGVTVTIDRSDAQCRNLTMTGSGTTLGPTLSFNQTGAPRLTIYRNLVISGGSGSGQGGRAKLTSNGNDSAVLVVLGGISTTSSNSSSNGNSGLNMNEGIVKLQGEFSDTIRNAAGLRLGNLQIGDGAAAKTIVWSSSKKTTLVVRSLLLKSHASFLIGDVADTNSGDIGNAAAAGVPTLNGGITVEPDARLLVRTPGASGAHGQINLDGGGIVSDGTITLYADQPQASSYTLMIGGFAAGSPASHQAIAGSASAGLADVRVAEGHTLEIDRRVNVEPHYHVTLAGSLSEMPGETIIGRVEAGRNVNAGTPESFGGIGCVIAASGAAPESTGVVRVTGSAMGPSILRYYDIMPEVNDGLDASLDFTYDDSELNGQDPNSLRLWRSGTQGATWEAPPGSTANPGSHTIHLAGIGSFSRWTASDASHVLENATIRMQYTLARNWNLVSVPLKVADASRTSLFPGSADPAFGFSTTYFAAETLRPGAGYWLRVPSAVLDTIGGVPQSVDSVQVTAGWNLIGSSPFPVAASHVLQVPPGIVVSRYFGYENGYTVAQTLEPGKGYWVKIAGGGTLYFRPAP